jgi:hypothetical protein
MYTSSSVSSSLSKLNLFVLEGYLAISHIIDPLIESHKHSYMQISFTLNILDSKKLENINNHKRPNHTTVGEMHLEYEILALIIFKCR